MRVLVVDEQRMVGESLVHVLSDQPGISVARSALDTVDLRDGAEPVPRVVVLDWTPPDELGAAVVAACRRACPGAKVLVLADLDEASAVSAALAAGCDGFITRDRGLADVIEAVSRVGRGEAVLSPAAAAALRDGEAGSVDRAPVPVLSARELEIVRALARGLSNRAIADELYLSVHTVRNHVQRICRRLGLRTRVELVVLAARRGLIDLTVDE